MLRHHLIHLNKEIKGKFGCPAQGHFLSRHGPRNNYSILLFTVRDTPNALISLRFKLRIIKLAANLVVVLEFIT